MSKLVAERGRRTVLEIPSGGSYFFTPKWRRTNSRSVLSGPVLSGFVGHPPHDFALDLQGVHLLLEPSAEPDLVNVVALVLPGFQGLAEVVQEDRRRLRR